MARIKKAFSKLKERKEKALVGYIVSGDPDISLTLKAMHLMVKEGVHVIELGIAFSDPMAEGPSIQKGHERALLNRVSLNDTLNLVKIFREKNNETPIVLMGYMNTFESLGSKVFSSEAKKSGVDGVLIVDMPLEESEEFTQEAMKNELDLIRLVAPTTNKSRIEKICKSASGYIYYISLKGITGANTLDEDDVRTKVSRLRDLTELPIVIGFGIKDHATTVSVRNLADGVVVGSVFVDIMGEKIEKIENLLSIKIQEISKAFSKK